MIKIAILFFLLFITTNCSLDTKSGIWSKSKNIDRNNIKNNKVTTLFEKKEINKKEFNTDFKINTPLEIDYNKKKSYQNNNFNIQNINNNLRKISKYNFSRIKNFEYFDPKLVFHNNNLIFFDKVGTIIKFDNKSKILWKKNYYSKNEKKLFPVLNLSTNGKILIVTDSLSKYYAVNIDTGELLWMNDHISIFISQIKIDNDKIYIIDSNNIFNCFSLNDGKKLWSFEADKDFIKSQKKLSIIFDKEIVYFSNANGDLYALGKKNGNLIWLTPTKNSNDVFQSFMIRNSDLVLDLNNIYFSNNQNTFFSIDKRNGIINWTQNINSDLRPIISKDLIFTISIEGYLFVVDKKSGNILRINDTFSFIKEKKRKKIYPVGFVLNNKSIYITLNNGRMIEVDISSGKNISTLKISRDMISEPFVNNNQLFIIKDNEIIKLN